MGTPPVYEVIDRVVNGCLVLGVSCLVFGVWGFVFCVWFAGRSACPERSRRVSRFGRFCRFARVPGVARCVLMP
ncbi:hypothetical protein D3OALGB2SA_682 [Olavius algarvensis associated proteobacterium Delta 3]|nr:hypothetical protein D3OALGB2SA_682 [Olavius algarvensis associated proteobacterium Delta 3]